MAREGGGGKVDQEPGKVRKKGVIMWAKSLAREEGGGEVVRRAKSTATELGGGR